MSETKKQRQQKNSKRTGKSVLPIYTATTKAIINRIFAIKNKKYNYHEISPTNKIQVRVAYVMMVHSMHRAQQPGAAECRARLNFVPRRIRCVVVVSRECRGGAKIDYFPSILIPGRNYCITQCSILLRILAQKLRHQNHIFE